MLPLLKFLHSAFRRRPGPLLLPVAARRARTAGLLLLAPLAVVPSLAAESARAATIEIGAVEEIRAATAPSATAAGGFAVQATEAGSSYAVPAGYDTITSWSHRTGTVPGNLTFKVFRPTGVAKEWLAVASDTRTVAAGLVQTFPVQIAVRPGDKLGLSSDDVELAYETGDIGDRIGFFGIDLAPGATRTTFGTPFPEFKLAVSAKLASTAAGGVAAPAPGAVTQPSPASITSSQRAVTALRIAPASFRAARTGPSVRPAARPASAAKVTYRANVATKVRFTVRRLLKGRKRGSGDSARCVAPTRRNRSAATCVRAVRLSGSFSQMARAGTNSLRFSGRLGGRRLKSGLYRLVAEPASSSSSAQPAKKTFRIVR